MKAHTILSSILLVLPQGSQAFQASPVSSQSGVLGRPTVVGNLEAATARAFREEKPSHFLLDEFKTHSGELINPYETLKVSREADRTVVRRRYVELSKKYHPDGARHKDILPGKW